MIFNTGHTTERILQQIRVAAFYLDELKNGTRYMPGTRNRRTEVRSKPPL
jgi:hypothetical protein